MTACNGEFIVTGVYSKVCLLCKYSHSLQQSALCNGNRKYPFVSDQTALTFNLVNKPHFINIQYENN